MRSFHGRVILEELRRAVGAPSSPTALVTLVATRGSSFRKPGARMLVMSDGTRFGHLAGRCPESDLASHALEAIRCRAPRLVSYSRERGWDAMLDAGCTGELDVLVEPLEPSGPPDWLGEIMQRLDGRSGGFLITYYTRSFEGPKPVRTVHPTMASVREMLAPDFDPVDVRFEIRHPVTSDLDFQGGQSGVLVEPLLPRPRLVAIGSNPLAECLLRQGELLGWEPVLVDPTGAARPRPGTVLLDAPPSRIIDVLHPDRSTAVILTTHHFELDVDYLERLGRCPLGYLGAVGSRMRSASLRARVEALRQDFSGPAGLDLGGETPEEIALSIVAEIVATSNRKTGRRLRELESPIH